MKTDHDIRLHQRLMNNGRMWYCTPDSVKADVYQRLNAIGNAMDVALRYYVQHTTQSTRYDDLEQSRRLFAGQSKESKG